MVLPAKRIHPDQWAPIDVDQLEVNALKVVRSADNRSVIAGPGAGKTELLAQRAAYLFQTGSASIPRRILAISFKRDAATNLAARVRERCHESHTSRFDSMTFDAFAKGLVDRFGQTLPGRWRPQPDYEIMLRKDADEFEHRHQPNLRLREERSVNPTLAQRNTDRFWQSCLHEKTKTCLSFPMIGRLAELLIRINPMVRDALRLTYSYLFMDEFQDTTQIQYDLVQSIFLKSGTCITAVGDNKQKIMSWAGAMKDPFFAFESESDFGAKRTSLYNNYRSSPELVKIQYVLAQDLDTEVVEPVSKTKSTIVEGECAIWNFQTADTEAERLAAFVTAEMKANDLQPRDFVILVRQKADDYAKILEPAFRDAGVPIQNEAKMIGQNKAEMIDGIQLQNLLTEELSELLVMILRLAMTPQAGRYWSKCQSTLGALRGISLDNERIHAAVARNLDEFLTCLHTSHSAPPDTRPAARALVNRILDFFGRDRLIAAHPAYTQSDWFEKVAEAAAVHLHASSADAIDWIEAIDAYEGLHAIPLMTIHKSKGLEYHTVIFVGLDDSAWWSFAKDEIDAVACFLVAFSRAKQRAIFTYCADRGMRTKIARLYDLLQQASVPVVDIR